MKILCCEEIVRQADVLDRRYDMHRRVSRGEKVEIKIGSRLIPVESESALMREVKAYLAVEISAQIEKLRKLVSEET